MEVEKDDQEKTITTHNRIIGVIIPPPEIRAVVDKTAQFVGKNGKSFEQRILSSSEGKTAKFNFMREFDPYHAYYEMKIRETEEAIAKGIDPATLVSKPVQPAIAPEKVEPSKSVANTAPAKTVIASSAKAALVNPIAKYAKEAPNADPQPLEFIINHPNGTRAVDIDVIKLTAQYTAINGRDFLAALVQREQRNPLFDFLKPTHLLFSYFTTLVDAYAKILHPTTGLKEGIQEKLQKDRVIQKAVHRWAHHKAEEERKRQENQQTDADRLASQAIDWYDFTVVEVIDFREDELLEIPGISDLSLGQSKKSQAVIPPPPPPPPALTSGLPPPPPPPPLPPASSGSAPMVVEEDEEGLKVVTNYVPRIANPSASKKPLNVIDPVSGKSIEVDKLEEHMRIQLIDPKWREEQRRFQEKQKETGFAEGSSIADSLRVFARKRGDIFGQAVDGTNSAANIAASEDEERRRQEEASKIQWDGFQGTVANTQKLKEDFYSRVGAGAPPSSSVGAVPPVGPSFPPMPPVSSLPPPPAFVVSPPPPHLAVPSMPPMTIPAMPPMMPTYAMPMAPVPLPLPIAPTGPPLAMHRPPPPLPFGSPGQQPAPNRQSEVDEDVKSKRPRIELLSAEDFIANHPHPAALTIMLPNEPSFGFNGQSITLTTAVTTTAKEVKELLLQQLGSTLGAGKLQLRHASQGFLKDGQSLAAANIGDGTLLEASIKSRGGKR
eukprot:gene8913-9831_t